jgi:hypothetical protein
MSRTIVCSLRQSYNWRKAGVFGIRESIVICASPATWRVSNLEKRRWNDQESR